MKMSDKPIIAIDVDDVLTDENTSVMQFINEKYNLDLTLDNYLVEAPYRHYWEHVWQVSDEEGAQRFQAYLDAGIKAKHKVLPGAIKAITELKDKYELVIITSRDDRSIGTTHSWLELHFPKVFKSVEFVSVWSKDKKASKAEIAKHVGATYLIDDNAEHCELAAQEGITALLFGDYGWSRGYKESTGVTRVKDWQEVKEFFDARR